MIDIDLIWGCLLDKSYKDEIQLELLINKIEDKKLATGFLTNLWLNHKVWEIDKDFVVNIISSYLGETPNKELLLDSSSYFQAKMDSKDKRETELAKFLVDFLTILSDEISLSGDVKSDFELKDIETSKLEEVLSEQKDKTFIKDLKDKLLKMEMYEVLPLIDKYL